MQLFRSPPHYVMRCGPIDLVTMSPRRLRSLPIGNGGPAAREDVMTWKFPVANKLAVLLAAGAVVAVGFAAIVDVDLRGSGDVGIDGWLCRSLQDF